MSNALEFEAGARPPEVAAAEPELLPDFDFNNYIRVDADDEAFKSKIEEFLKQMSKTPEGQSLLMDVWGKNNGIRVVIDARRGDLATQMIEAIGITGSHAHDMDKGRIRVSPYQAARMRYTGTDGNLHDASIGTIVYHELVHFRDDYEGLNTAIDKTMIEVARALGGDDITTSKQASQYFDKLVEEDPRKESEIREALGRRAIENNKPAEVNAISKTNEFMSKYFGEPPRADHDGDLKGTRAVETYPGLMFNRPSGRP